MVVVFRKQINAACVRASAWAISITAQNSSKFLLAIGVVLLTAGLSELASAQVSTMSEADFNQTLISRP